MMQTARTLLPRFIVIGSGLVDKIVLLLQGHGVRTRRALVLADLTTARLGGREIARRLRRSGVTVAVRLVRDSTMASVRRVMAAADRVDLVIGFGGGRVLDVAKLAAGNAAVRFVSMPTILSNDGIASPVAVIKDRNGIPVSHITRPAVGVLVDLAVIRSAPIRHLRAGVGDLMSNLSAVHDARRAAAQRSTTVDREALHMASAGALRLLKHRGPITGSNFLLSLTHGLLESGMAMCLVGSSRPASGSEHKISHALDYLARPRRTLHGEQVGIAALFTMALQHNRHLQPLIELYARIGMPMTLRYLDVTFMEFCRVVAYARSIRPERPTVLDRRELNVDQVRKIAAMIAARRRSVVRSA